jgi:hypothetical protein
MNGRSTTGVVSKIKVVGQECPFDLAQGKPTHTGIARDKLQTQGPLRLRSGQALDLAIDFPGGNSIAALGMTGQVVLIERGHEAPLYQKNFCIANIIREIKAAKFSKFQIRSHRGEVFSRGPEGAGMLGSERNSLISRCLR